MAGPVAALLLSGAGLPVPLVADGREVWDLSDPEERIEFYELVLCHGTDEVLVETVDGALLVEAWPSMRLPDSVRAAWQPLIDQAKSALHDPPRDPAGFSARIAAEIGMAWPRKTRRDAAPSQAEAGAGPVRVGGAGTGRGRRWGP